MKKGIVILLVCSISLLLSACSKKAGVDPKIINEDAKNIEIVYDTEYVPEAPYFYVSHEVIKRQTNIENKEDIIFLESHYKNDYFEITADVTLHYNFYDEGGWILDDKTFEIKDSYATSSPDFKSFFEKLYKNRYMNFHCDYNNEYRLTRISDIIYEGVDFDIDSQSARMKIRLIQGDVGEINAHYLFEYSFEKGWHRIDDKFEGYKYVTSGPSGSKQAYCVAVVDDVRFDFEHTEGTYDSLKISNFDMELLTVDVSQGGSSYGDQEIKRYNLDPFTCKLYSYKYAKTYQYNFSSKKWV